MNEINFQIEDIEKIDLSMDVGVKEIFPPIENLEVNPSKEQQVFNHENSYGYDEVIVNPIPDEYIIPDGTLDVNANGDVDVTMFKMARVGVYTPPNLQDKELTINENGTHSIKADEGYDGLNQLDLTVEIEGKEDLTEELNTYNTELTEQETKIADVIELLQTKATPTAEKYAPRHISFSGYQGTDLDYEIANLDASNITRLNSMFQNNMSLTSLDLSNLTFGKITTMTSMFASCNALADLKLCPLDASETTSMQAVFMNCIGLETIDLSTWDLSNITNMQQTFSSCSSLKKLDVRTISFGTKVSNSKYMLNSVPTSCEIIVKDDTAKSWFASEFSSYTNVKTVAELEG